IAAVDMQLNRHQRAGAYYSGCVCLVIRAYRFDRSYTIACIPGILPTAIMMFILEIGKIMNIGFQKAYLMQNGLNISASEIIPTYIYKVGLIDAQFSYSAAIGLFNNIINIILLVSVNRLAQKTSEHSLW
ncbi:MAG: hypothetical protein PHY87_11735, partial [Sphaerochaeta sp.]|nr:hypothetical protein [Sphaerochaeta sp.]